MTTKFLSVLFLSLIFLSCNNDPETPLIEGTWILTSGNGYTHDFDPNNLALERYSGWSFDGVNGIDSTSSQGVIVVDIIFHSAKMAINANDLVMSSDTEGDYSFSYLVNQNVLSLYDLDGLAISYEIIELTESSLILRYYLVEDLSLGATTTHDYMFYYIK